ncbi:MAG: alpha/beta hydrolase [Steroidobacteraceae bacterium]|jgi:pimeloyl-ACP methyl ester carboxylesterase|nr:alpha/beta hydrolase [Steroidobacteraceae bacterium]
MTALGAATCRVARPPARLRGTGRPYAALAGLALGVAIATLSAAPCAQAATRGTPAAAASPAEAPPPRLSLEELRRMYRSPQDRVLDVDGVEVYYRDEGRGPAMLLIHGSQSTLRTWDELARVLRRSFRVVRYDVPPNGLSGPIPDAVLGRLRPSDVPARLLAHLGIGRATVVGVSSGGTTGIFLAAEHPDLVERLVVSCAPADPVDMSKLVKSPAMLEAERLYGDYMDYGRSKPRSFWRTYVDFYSARPGRVSDDIVQQMYDFTRRVPERHATALTGVVADQAKAIGAMNAVRQPVLLLWGAADPLLPPSAAHALAKHLKNASLSLLMIPDASHYPPMEIPRRYAAVLATWMTQATPPP